MVGLGIISSVLRSAGLIPTVMMGGYGLDLSHKAKTMGDIYDVIPHGRTFLQGLRIVGRAGVATFLWNFVMFFGSLRAHGAFLIMIGLVDLTLTVTLICGAVMQAKFVPRSFSGCKDATNWNNGTDGRNFFLAVNESSEFDYASPKSACYAFARNWQVTIGCIVLYFFCTLSTLLLGCLEPPGSYSLSSHFDDGLKGLLHLIFIRPFSYLLARILPVVQFAVRYSSKFASRRRANGTARARKIELSHEMSVYGQKSPSPGGSKALPTQVVIRIAQQLHYVDLVNLSHSSKRLRTVFFGHGDPAKKLDQLRQHCCEGDKKSQCRVCDRQVCETCSSQARHRKSYASQHLTKCRPVCTKCFYIDFCHATNRDYQKLPTKHSSSCWSSTEKKDVENGIGQGYEAAEEPICRLCYEKMDTERMKRIEAQDAAELQRLAKHPLVCHTCKDPLPSRGPRWWSCTDCQVECKSHAHPSWAVE